MDVYLVHISRPLSRDCDKIAFPLGIASIAKSLSIHGIDFKLLDLAPVIPSQREEVLIKTFKGQKDLVIGLGTIIIGNRCLENVIRYIDILKDICECKIVMGGPLPSAIPDLFFEHTKCDYVIAGEGEERFANLITSLSNRKEVSIPCVYSRKKMKGDKLERLYDLDRYTPLPYDKFDIEFYMAFYKKHNLSFEMLASRGCDKQCSFCFRFMGNGHAERSIDSIMNEIEYITKRWKIPRILFHDENFLADPHLFSNILREKHNRHLDFKFRIKARIDCLTTDILNSLSNQDVMSIGLGIESLSQKVLNSLNKRIDIEDEVWKLSALNEKGIDIIASFIIGNIDETEENLKDLYRFIKHNNVHGVVNFLTPLPRTPLYYRVKNKLNVKDEWEYVNILDKAVLFDELVFNLSPLPSEMLIDYWNMIHNVLHDKKKIGQEYMVYVDERVTKKPH